MARRGREAGHRVWSSQASRDLEQDTALQCSAEQRSALQCSAIQCSAVQCNTVQCSWAGKGSWGWKGKLGLEREAGAGEGMSGRFLGVGGAVTLCSSVHCGGSAVQCDAEQNSAVQDR